MKIVIFAGGVGTRLWPLSRKKSPKQFEKVIDDESTLQHLVARLLQKFSASDIFISTGSRYRATIGRQLPQISNENIIIEPEMRDVGPAVGLMTAIFAKVNPDESMAILWGDHIVNEDAKFHDMLTAANEVIEKNPEKIMFLGHVPRFANQNLGWIEFEKAILGKAGKFDYHSLASFKYRPEKKLVEDYAVDGSHAWNLGYFVTKPRFLWEQFRLHSPELYEGLKKIQDSYGTLEYGSILSEVYSTLPKVSFDHAVLEKIPVSQSIVMVADIGWSDVGAWEALKEALQKSKEDNVTKGKVVLEGSVDSLVFDYQGKKLVVGIDLQDMLVVNTEDVLLVAPKTSASKVKKLVEGFAGGEYEELT
ncbi:mannose-1-phosphate guanylyltransferase [Candidatus Woesebacteria bacterium]|nr:mannose-1-phosphate guanylyltransferase [Candidatus Woesebacteria bacterium]